MRLFGSIFHAGQANREVDEELRAHIAHRADDLERGGLPRNEAERRARVEFGGYVRFRQESYESLGTRSARFVETMLQDTRLALRVLLKSKGFTFTAVLTLALAIGANAVVFSVLNSFLLRPLAVANPESLFAIFHGGDASQSYLDYLDLRDRNHSFESLAAFGVGTAGLDTGNDPSRSWIYETSGNYFDTLGVHPFLGHFFHASDERGPNSAPYIVLTYAYWRNRFQEDRSVIGRVVQVNTHPFTIVGVAPPEFHGTLMFFNPDFFVPLVNESQTEGEDELNMRGKTPIFMTIGHLKPGVTEAQAAADLDAVGAFLTANYPKEHGKLLYSLGRPNLYGDYLGGPVKAFMTGLMLLSGLILLAACANLGSLFAARAADRSREVALRLALGSSRKRILRALFTEAILVSTAGGVVGISLSVVLLRAMSQWQPFSRWPIHLAVDPDAKVYAVAVLLTLASGLLFGAVPVRQVLRTNPYEVVKAGMAGAASNGRRFTARDLLLVVQIAVCGVLVTSSMAAVRGLVRSLHSDFGFATENRMVVDTDLSMVNLIGDAIPAMQKRMADVLRAIPGVESVGESDRIPLGDGAADTNIFADATTDLRPANAAGDPYLFRVSPEYFQAAGTPLIAGRAFTPQDDKKAPRVAMVNRLVARKLFGSEPAAIGKYLKLPDGSRLEVVGVTEGGKYASLTDESQPAMFVPLLQDPMSVTLITVHSKRDPAELGQIVQTKLRNLVPALPLDIHTRYSGLDPLMFGPRIATISLGVLGAIGAVLSITGIFGMAAYTVSKRQRELGIRMALGAQRREILEAALSRALKLLGIGSLAGLGLGILAGQVMAHVVNEASARDPLVLAGVVLAMVLLGLAATWIPARRALATDPMALLREE